MAGRITSNDFYPRSPCGERLHLFASSGVDFSISIHALLAESDPPVREIIQWEGIFLSTLSLRRATESQPPCERPTTYFYPRSPCGERLLIILCQLMAPCISIHALLAESDFGCWMALNRLLRFLSTLSLRRATYQILEDTSGATFLSTLSLRRATAL